MIKKKKYPMTRENWILQMYDFGEKGIKDFDTVAKKIIPPTKKLIKKTPRGLRLKRLDSTLDVEGYDKPRIDIKNLRLKNKVIRIGSDTIDKNLKNFKKFILPTINNAFTKDELKNIDIYIEYPSNKLPKGFGGTSTGWESEKNKKFSTIDLSTTKDAPTAIHEILHAMKYENNKYIRNPSMDESETELETYLRLNPKMQKKVPCDDGYYAFVKGNKCKARKEDVKIIKSSCNIKDKKRLTKCIIKNLKKTNIGKIKVPKKYILKV